MNVTVPKKKEADDESDFFSWHANIITVDRHKILLFVNNSTRLAIIIARPKASDYKQIETILENGIRTLFAKLGVHPEVIEQYFKEAGAFRITSTGTRGQISRMIKAVDHVKWYAHDFSDCRLQTPAMVDMASWPVNERDKYMVPQEKLYRQLCIMKGLPEDQWDKVRTEKSYVLRVTLDLKNHDIYRLIQASDNVRFDMLHKAIQESFGWFDCHAHMFTVFDEEIAARQGGKYRYANARMYIKDYEDPYADVFDDSKDTVVLKDRHVLLSDIFDKRDSCLYTYDFGDG
ncbi:MAG: plasmid pRiA4b ORF-3 family protein, partial [Solobacterium sp.]|nr:plasmid pRiA4b ORF-3 family protein [Solobacterium sp.]